METQATLKAMAAFACVVQTTSFTLAAEQMGVSKSAISKDIAWLEKYLGNKLLNRTTRQVHTTELGSLFYTHCERILQELHSAKALVDKQQSTPMGLIRLSAPSTFGLKKLLIPLQELSKRYPKLDIDLNLTTNFQKRALFNDEIDMSIIVTNQPPETYVAKKLMDIQWRFCASPDFIRQHGEPVKPADISQFPSLTYRHRHPANHTLELHNNKGNTSIVRLHSRLRCNSSLALMESAIAGLGIAYLPDYVVKDALKANELITVMNDWHVQKESCYAIYKPNLFLLPKVRVLINCLADAFNTEII